MTFAIQHLLSLQRSNDSAQSAKSATKTFYVSDELLTSNYPFFYEFVQYLFN